MMIAGGQDMAVLARDALYAAVMIICTGGVGQPIIFGGAVALLAWALFTLFVLRLLRRNAPDHDTAA